MQIVQLDEKIYKNQPFTVKYRTKGYYDIRRSGTTFSLEYVPFGEEKALMQAILAAARESGARMAVLETQTCNERAIAFYRKMGFEIIGFDLYAYTNQDPERHEVRLEMGLKL